MGSLFCDKGEDGDGTVYFIFRPGDDEFEGDFV